MLTYMKERVAERVDLTNAMTHMTEQAVAAGRDLTEVETATIADMESRCRNIDAQLQTHNEQLASARAFADLQTKLESHREQDEQRVAAAVETTDFRSWGQQVVESEEFRTYGGRGQSTPVDVGSFLEERVPITTTTLNIPPFQWTPREQTFKPLLLNLVGRVLVSSGAIEWVEMGTDPVAAVVAEGQPKPEASWTSAPKTASLETIAHWVQITRQALEDASYIRSLIESKLRRGLLAKAEADIAAAIVAATLPTATDADLLAAIRLGIAEVETRGYSPNTVLLNPADYAGLDITVLQETNGGPSRQFSYWGLTPVPSPVQPAGTATVGDFQTGVTLFDRGTTSVFMSDSHASLFISNILVILAEARLKSVVTDPGALCECTATP
jgi:HK97 family phage major capsid protein